MQELRTNTVMVCIRIATNLHACVSQAALDVVQDVYVDVGYIIAVHSELCAFVVVVQHASGRVLVS